MSEKNERTEEAEMTSEPSWMPLEGIVEQWGVFGGTYVTYPAFMATSQVFAAFSFEANALSQYNEACRARRNGAEITARAAFEQVVEDLQNATSRWMSVLYWLERLVGSIHTPFERGHIRTLFAQATEQIARLGVLSQQVHQACVQFYQQHGMLIDAQTREKEL